MNPSVYPRVPLARLALLLVVAFGFIALHPSPVRAATIQVTTTADASPPPGTCSLRQAIEAANSDTAVGVCSAGSGPDTITFAAGVTGTIALTTALPAITSAITIQGPGATNLTIDGSGAGTVGLLQVAFGAQLSLTGLTLANGARNAGGAIFNEGTLTITSSILSGNQAAGGGAIINSGSLSITSSTFSDNDARGRGAGGGGAILNERSLTITNSTFSGNQADNGGAIDHAFGSLTITGSTFSANTATSAGGAIFNQAGGRLSLTNSTLSGNTAEVGGAIATGSGASGGDTATTTLLNSTIAANQSGGAVLAGLNAEVTVRLRNVVLANPVLACSGPLIDQGGNLASDGSCPFTQPSSKANVNLLLGPLQDNGGPTLTMALLPDSPAIDAGVNCPPPVTDQRGESRTTPCSSGAVETDAAIRSLSPTSGPEAGGTLVTIMGSGFVPGQTSVSFGITPALSVDCPSTTLCQAVSPPGTGTVQVLVTAAGQASTSVVVGDFTYLPTAPTPSQPMTLAVQVWRQIPPIVSENQTEITVVPVAGGVVEALVDGVVCGEGMTDSQGRTQLIVAADPPVAGCGRPERALSFRVNGQAAASDHLAFHRGGQAAVTLILPGPMPPPRR